MPVNKVCEQCGTDFQVPQRRSEEVRFCCIGCKTAAGRVTLSCGHCAKVFERKRSEVRGAATSYCSMDCLHASNVGRAKPIPAGQVRYEKVCEQCAKSFKVTKTRMATARFCSRACQSASPTWQQECKERVQREQHWRWQGGKYKDKSVYLRASRAAGVLCEHRKIFAAHMAATVPGHPFLYEKDGVLRLHKHIHVHHIDQNPKNNELGNLMALTAGAHAKLHHSGRKPEPWECWYPSPEK